MPVHFPRSPRVRRARDASIGALALGVLVAAGCAHLPGAERGPKRYRLSGSGVYWDVSGDDAVLEDLQPRYPDFFEVVLDPAQARLPETRGVRRDLEKRPVDRRNYDALNAVAIAYFEINYRGEAYRRQPGGMRGFLAEGQRAAKLAAIPWRAYMEIEDGRLREAILDFFADAATGEKLGSAATANRLVEIVASLRRRTEEPERRERIDRIVAALRETARSAEESGAYGLPPP